MWSILYNGHTVALPNSDDFYTVITDTTKMFTTNVDLPITEDLINMFNIKGLLTREDGVFFKKVTLPCTLQGFGVRIPCKISIESIKQKEGLLNLYLEAKSTIAYSLSEMAQLPNGLWENYHYPMLRNDNSLPYFWGGLQPAKYYSDNSTSTDNQIIGTNLPFLTRTQLNSILNLAGYANITMPDYHIYPNQIYMNGKYKMRRVFCEGKIDDIGYGVPPWASEEWTIDEHKLYKGDYAGLTNDVCKYEFYCRNDGGSIYTLSHRYYNNLQMNSPFDNIFLFYKNTESDSGMNGVSSRNLYVSIESREDFHIMHYTNGQLADDVITNRYNYTWNQSTTTDLSFNYLIIQQVGNISKQEFDIRFTSYCSADIPASHSGTFSNKLYLQYFFDDTFEGVVKLEGDLADETYSSETGHTYAGARTTSKHFNSMGYGALGWTDYNPNASNAIDTTFTDFTPPAQLLNNPIWHDYYKSSPALMWVNILDCFEGISFYDILERWAAINGNFLNINTFSWSIDLADDLPITNIEDYILYDELVLDDEYPATKYEFANQDIEDADVGLKQNLLIQVNGKHISRTDDESNTDADSSFYAIKNYNPEVTTDYSEDKNLFTKMKRYYINDDHCYIATFNKDASGFAMFNPAAPEDNNLANQENIWLPTTLEIGQIVNTHVVGYIPTQFVNYQTRTFRVLEQEIDASGVNNLKLLLYK